MSTLRPNINGEIRLCCGGKGCPVVRLVEDRVVITDDYGSEINISSEEAGLVTDAVATLLTSDEVSTDSK